jgi:MFS transporter, SET family, sugar efflux transporter
VSPAAGAADGLVRYTLPLAGAVAAYGLMAAATNTSMSLFLTDAVKAAPFLVGMFFTVRAAAGIVVGLVAGWLSDRVADRRVIMGTAGMFGTVGALCLVFFRDYWVLLVTTTIFLSIGGAAFGQMFAYSNEFATARGRDVTAFSSVIRSVFSAAFVIGAPLGLSVVARYGFTPLYLGLAALTLVSAVIGRWGLRKAPRKVSHGIGGRQRGGAWRAIRGGLPGRLMLLLGVILVLGLANQMYNIDIALHVTKDLHHSASLVGWMLGLTAALEVPAMILAGRAARRVGSGRLVGLSAVVAIASYCLVPLAATPVTLLAVSALIGVWQGVTLSIPMVMVQSETPGGLGLASSLYGAAFSSAGLFAGGVVGVTAAAVGYGGVLWLCAGLCAVAAAGMAARLLLPRRTTVPAA